MKKGNGWLLAAGAALSLTWSCGETTERIITNTVHDTVTVYADTLFDTLTLYDTVPVVVTRWDTMFVAGGRPAPVLFGIVYDISLLIDTSGSADTVYGGVTCLSNPARRDLRVSINGDSLRPVETQSEYILRVAVDDVMYGSLFPALNSAALVTSTLYERFVGRAAQYAFSAVVPVYPADTLDSLMFDTVSETITVPRPGDALEVYSGEGAITPVADGLFGPDSYYVISSDSTLTAAWSSPADFNIVTMYKVTYYGNTPYLSEPPYDTVVSGTAVNYSRSTMAQDPRSPYDAIFFEFIGVNGPVPGSWDTLPSLDGHGVLLAINYEIMRATMVPEGSAILNKRLAAAAPGDIDRPSPLAVVRRALGMPAQQ